MPLHGRAGVAAIKPGLKRIRVVLQRAVEAGHRIFRPADRIEHEPAIDQRLGAPRIGGDGALVNCNGFGRLSAVDQRLGGIDVGLEEIRFVGKRAFEAPQCFVVVPGRPQRRAEQVMCACMGWRELDDLAQETHRLLELALLRHDQRQEEDRVDVLRLPADDFGVAHDGVRERALPMQHDCLLHQKALGGLRHALTSCFGRERALAGTGPFMPVYIVFAGGEGAKLRPRPATLRLRPRALPRTDGSVSGAAPSN